VEVAQDGHPLVQGADWQEVTRLAHTCSDNSTRYWSHCIRILQAQKQGIYRVTWRELVVPDYIRGIRAVRVDTAGKVIFGPPAKLRDNQNYPNGITWDALPAGYKVEIWRKTHHRQEAGNTATQRHSGRRWMLVRTIPAEKLGFDFGFMGAEQHGATKAFLFTYLRPDGARSLPSPEVVVRHARGDWGRWPKIGGGRVLIK
jgi:hypothetical protein